jgi:hypothetical protein
MFDGCRGSKLKREQACVLVSCGGHVISEVAVAAPLLAYGRRVTTGSLL